MALLRKQTPVKELLRIGHLHMGFSIEGLYNFREFYLCFGDMAEGDKKTRFEYFCNAIEQTYLDNTDDFGTCSIYFNYYDNGRFVVVSTDLPQTAFYLKYKELVDLQSQYEVSACRYNMTIKTYGNDIATNRERPFNYHTLVQLGKEFNLIGHYHRTKTLADRLGFDPLTEVEEEGEEGEEGDVPMTEDAAAAGDAEATVDDEGDLEMLDVGETTATLRQDLDSFDLGDDEDEDEEGGGEGEDTAMRTIQQVIRPYIRRGTKDTVNILRKPDQQFVCALPTFNTCALLDSVLLFEDSNVYNRELKGAMETEANRLSVEYDGAAQDKYATHFAMWKSINFTEQMGDGSGGPLVNSKYRPSIIERTFCRNYRERIVESRARTRHTSDEVKEIRKRKLSIITFPFWQLAEHLQIRFRCPVHFLRYLNGEIAAHTRTIPRTRKKTRDMFRAFLRSDIIRPMTANILTHVFTTELPILHEKLMDIDVARCRHYIALPPDEFRPDIFSTFNIFYHVYTDLNMKTTSKAFFACFVSLLSGFMHEGNNVNVLFLGLPGSGKTFVLLQFFSVFMEYVDLLTSKESNRVSTTRINRRNYMIRAFTDAPQEIMQAVATMRSSSEQQFKKQFLQDIDGKIQAASYLEYEHGVREEHTVSRFNSRPFIGCSVQNMDPDDGGARRIYQCLIRTQRQTKTRDLFLTKSFRRLDSSKRENAKGFRNHMQAVAASALLYSVMHFVNADGGPSMPYTTDIVALSVAYNVARRYEQLYAVSISTDTMKRVQATMNVMCLVRNIEELFCYPDSLMRGRVVDPLALFAALRERLFVRTQDLVMAVNILNDEFFDSPRNDFMKFVQRKWQLDKLQSTTGDIFASPEVLGKFFMSKSYQNVAFLQEKEGTGTDEEVFYDPNYIVISMERPRAQAVLLFSEFISVPPSQIDNVLRALKGTISAQPYKRVKVQWQSSVRSASGAHHVHRSVNTADEFVRACTPDPSTADKNMFRFKEIIDRHTYKMVFHVQCFRRIDTYKNTQKDAFVRVMGDTLCHDGQRLDKMFYVDDEDSKFRTLSLAAERVKRKTNYERELARAETASGELRALAQELMTATGPARTRIVTMTRRVKRALVKKARDKAWYMPQLRFKNPVRADRNLFGDSDGFFTSNRALRKIFSQPYINVPHDIDDLSQEIHNHLLNMSDDDDDGDAPQLADEVMT